MKAGCLVAAWCAVGSVSYAHAERAYFAGVVVRTDRATHATRVSGGVQVDRWAVQVVLDPTGYRETGEQSDTDIAVEREVRDGWAVLGGWRIGTTPILGRSYWYHRPFVGISAPLPSLLWGRVRTRVGGELAITAVKHGDELPTMMGAQPGWGLFLRAELAGGF